MMAVDIKQQQQQDDTQAASSGVANRFLMAPTAPSATDELRRPPTTSDARARLIYSISNQFIISSFFEDFKIWKMKVVVVVLRESEVSTKSCY